MANFTGFLQADGYSGFQAMYHPARTKPGPIIEIACWAHCRRKVFDVWEQTKSPVAKEALDRIAAIYVIGDKARFAPAAERVEHRKETAPLLEAFFTWAEAAVVKLSAKSALAEAFRYILKRREALTPLCHQRTPRGRQQHRRERDAQDRTGPAQLPVCRIGPRRRAGGIHLYARRHGSAQRAEPGGLPQGHPDQDRRRASHQPDR